MKMFILPLIAGLLIYQPDLPWKKRTQPLIGAVLLILHFYLFSI